MLSRQEAVSFTRDVLGQNLEFYGYVANLPVLNRIIRSFQEKVPFQNLTLLAMKKKDRKLPSRSDIKASMLSKTGGLCYPLNLFMCKLLNSLGCDAHTGLGHVQGNEDHVVVIVKNVESTGDSYLVDVGFGFPTFEAVPLDFEVETDIYQQSFSTFKYVRHNDRIARLSKTGSNPKEEEADKKGGFLCEEGWKIVYDFSVEKRDLSDPVNLKSMDNIYANYDKTSVFHGTIRVVAFPHGKAICFKDFTMLTENENKKLDPTAVNGNELFSLITKNFPQFNLEIIQNAIKNLRETVLESETK